MTDVTFTAIRVRSVAASAFFALALALLAAACGSGGSSNSNSDAIAAINAIDGSGMHEIDQAIQTGTIPPTAQSVASHMQTILMLTAWPAELKAPATKLAGLFGTMANALNTDKPDMAKVQTASANAHAAWHQFSSIVWTYLGDKAGVKNADAPTPTS